MKCYFHFRNDYSGSTISLANKLHNLKDVYIVTCFKNGPLDNFDGKFLFRSIPKNKLILFSVLAIYQLISLFYILFNFKKFDIIHFNTLNTSMLARFVLFLNFIGLKINYILHLHEFKLNNSLLNSFFFFFLSKRIKVTFVSNYHRRVFPIKFIKSSIEPNTLPTNAIKFHSNNILIPYSSRFRLLFVGSTVFYKGFMEFLSLSKLLDTKYTFTAILSDEPVSIPKELLSSIDVYIRPDEELIYSLYSESLLVFNLSDVNYWVETFGMTIYEGIFFGCLPVTPALGGFTDFTEDQWSIRYSGISPSFVNSVSNFISEDIWVKNHSNMLNFVKQSNFWNFK